MDFKYQKIASSQIDTANTSYRISTHDATEAMVASIEALGILNPPILFPNGPDFTIVTGFARVNACLQCGKQLITCRVMDADASQAARTRIAVTDNAMHRELSLLEQANAVGLLAQSLDMEADLVQTARACGLAVNRDMARKLLSVSQMPLELKQGLTDGYIALPVALQLNEMDNADANALAELFSELKVGLNRQREFVDWVVAIARRDSLTVVACLQSDDLRKIRTDPAMERPQKGQALRDLIRRMRYPAISHHEARYAKTVQALKLKKGMKLVAPAHFESPMYRLTFDFQSFGDLQDRHKELGRLVKSHSIQDLWKDNAS